MLLIGDILFEQACCKIIQAWPDPHRVTFIVEECCADAGKNIKLGFIEITVISEINSMITVKMYGSRTNKLCNPNPRIDSKRKFLLFIEPHLQCYRQFNKMILIGVPMCFIISVILAYD